MAAQTTKTTANSGTCPYLHQLQADWLSMDPQGYYCRGYLGRITMLDSANDLSGCALRHFSACSEYQAVEMSGTRT